MKDREKIKLCAEAMKLDVYWGTPGLNTCPLLLDGGDLYDPRHDDEQAMALVKKFHIHIDNLSDGMWSVDAGWLKPGDEVEDFDLNRAIVECVAKMQAAKK